MTRVYEYDVFISYQRTSSTVVQWIRNHFHPRLREALGDNAEYEVKIFFDEQVPVGTSLPAMLRTALQRTRILLPICSPGYFTDEWCSAEWKTMEHREKIVGQKSSGRRLLYPIIFSDSERYPDWAKTRQMRSCKEWNLYQPQFQVTTAYLDFYQAVGQIAEELVRLIDQAPEWHPDWPVLTPRPEPPIQPDLPRF